MRIERHLDELATRVMREALGLSEDAPAALRPTADPRFGDYQVNGAMGLAKRLKKNPRELAGPLCEALLQQEPFASAEVAGPGFVNLRLSDEWVADRLTNALRDGREGVPLADARQKIVVDFSSPNIAKQMHVGHLRSTIIGDSIVRILRFAGHEVIGDNHLGDWGTQFGLLIVGMREWGSESALVDDPIPELERVYKLASERAGEDEAFAGAARAELAKLQAGDPDNRALWERFVKTSRTSLDAVYDRLGVNFDLWLGESAYHDALPGVTKLLRERGLAREDQGALCVFFEEIEDAPAELKKRKEPFIIQKQDGAYLYSTTDIATVRYRRRELGADHAIYVVDSRQALHFKQLFAVMKLLGEDIELTHVAFGKILGTDGKPLRTRDASGKVIPLMSLLSEAEERARQRIEQGVTEGRLRVSPEDLPRVARAVGIGAVKYADLMQNRMTDYQFDWDKMVSFSGHAGPYLQYAYARIQSIFRKGEVDLPAIEAGCRVSLGEPAEATLGRSLLRFADVIHRAAESYQPHLVCDHVYDVARSLSSFYESCPVLDAEEPVRGSRLALIALTARQLRRGLSLLGIEVVDQM